MSSPPKRIKNSGTTLGPRSDIKPPEIITEGPFQGQTIGPMSPQRSLSITKQLLSEFPPVKKKKDLPLETHVQGRATELVLGSYLSAPRPGGKSFNVFDANTLDQTFPAVDLFAVQKDDPSKQLHMLQSKAHLSSTVKQRASQFKSDTKKDAEKSESLAKRVHRLDPGYLNYGDPLASGLKKIKTNKTDRGMFEREESSSDDEDYFDRVEDKREKLTEFVQERLQYPTSPKTAKNLGSQKFVPMPVHTEDIRTLVGGIEAKPVKPRKIKTEEDDDPTFDGQE